MNFSKFNSKIVFLLTAFLFLSNCEALKPDWSKTAEPDGKKRARKNVEEGRGFSLGLGKSGGDSNFLFASSNPMWRASLDTRGHPGLMWQRRAGQPGPGCPPALFCNYRTSLLVI